MEIYDSIEKWFAEHHTVRKIVKGTIFAGLGLVVATQTEFIAWVELQVQMALPEWMPLWFLIKPSIIGLFIGLGNWLQYNTTLPVVGKKAPPPAKKVYRRRGPKVNAPTVPA